MNTLMKFVALAVTSVLTSSHAYAFGIDRMVAEIDASSGFKGVATFVLFNDGRDAAIFTTAKAFSWDMSSDGQMTMTPSADLQIFPSVQKIAAGESASFKVRYRGSALAGKEGGFRVLFSEVVLPKQSGTVTSKDDIKTESESISAGISAGLAMSVPVYVSDFSTRADSLEKVSVRMLKVDGKPVIEVDNPTNRHITVSKYVLNGKESGALGVVLATRKRDFPVNTEETVKDVALTVSRGTATREIRIEGSAP